MIKNFFPYFRRNSVLLKTSRKGFTLVEVLTVVSVVAALLGAIASVFVLTLQSYTGEYELESLEGQSQRALVELDYFVRRATVVEIQDAFGNAVLAGNVLVLGQPRQSSILKGINRDLGSVVFIFAPNADPDAPLGKGRLSVQFWTAPPLSSGGRPPVPLIPSVPANVGYVYSHDFYVEPGSTMFSYTQEGNLSYKWSLVVVGRGGQAVGRVPVEGVVTLR